MMLSVLKFMRPVTRPALRPAPDTQAVTSGTKRVKSQGVTESEIPAVDHAQDDASHTSRVTGADAVTRPEVQAPDLGWEVTDSDPPRLADFFAWCERYHSEIEPIIGNDRTWPQIHGSYNEYCEFVNKRPLTAPEFARQLKHAGITKYQGRQGKKVIWRYRFTGLVPKNGGKLGPNRLK